MSDEEPTTSKKKDEMLEKAEEPAETATKQNNSDSSDDDVNENLLANIQKFFMTKFHISDQNETVEKVIPDLTFDGLVHHWRQKGFKNIIMMVGAGISTSAGIPDFRSPGSGLYDNLQKYKLPYPQAIFDINYFERNPKPFFTLAKELYPGNFIPTPSHYFVRLLHEKGLLLRHYTQNIDTLERVAGIPDNKLVEAHGSFYTNHCLGCRKQYSMQWMKQRIFADTVPSCERCKSVVKPDIVFFSENLPDKFYELPQTDFKNCDLLIIMGTSLEVQPFASLVDHAPPKCLRLLINREKVGQYYGSQTAQSGLLFDSEQNTRDIAYEGDCDDGVLALAKALGWDKELNLLIKNERAKLAKNTASAEQKKEEQLPESSKQK